MRLIPLAAACLLLPLGGAAAQTAANPAPAAKAPAQPAAQPAPAQTAAPQPAAAQPPAPQPVPKPTDAARKAAIELNEKLQFTNQVNGILGNVRGQIIVGLARGSNKTPEQVQPIVDEIVMPDFTSHAKELGDTIIDRWATSFTVDELRGLRNFYTSPLGEKLVKTMPVLSQEIGRDGGQWAQAIFQKSLQVHGDALRERGLTLPTEGARPNAP
jgi:hypothetical protein